MSDLLHSTDRDEQAKTKKKADANKLALAMMTLEEKAAAKDGER